MFTNRALVVCLSTVALAYGQDSFEVASIKPHPGIVNYSSDPAVKGNRVTATASTLIDIITSAYRVRYDQISGAASWMGSEHYDLEARAGDNAITREQMRPMLQALLAERFELRIHRETKEVPMYALVVGKNGAKLKESIPADQPKGQITGDGSGFHIDVAHETMARFADRLSGNGAGRPVLDKTGLTGMYTFKLDFARDPAPPDSEYPPLIIAIQDQLGLKLDPTKGPVEILVIDHAAKPTAN